MNGTGMSRGGTKRPSQTAAKARTFRSGPYLNDLFLRAGRMDEQLQAEICARIKLARKEAGMTLEDMADALGVTQRAYWNYEHNRVPFRRLDDIAEITATTQGWLLHGTPEPTVEALAIARIDAHLESLEGKVADGFEAIEAAIEQLASQLPHRDAQ